MTPRPRWIAAAAALLVSTGCAAAGPHHGTTPPDRPASASSTSSASSAPSTPGTPQIPASSKTAAGSVINTAPSTEPTDAAINPEAVDALSLTGATEVADVPDMQPVVADPVVTLPTTVTDSDGRAITVTRADRVIALDLYGTLTDTIIGLGLADRLVGRGASDTQTALTDLPIVSLGGIDLNIEAVLSLHPDVVLTTMTIGSKPLYEQLEAAGVTVVRFASVPTIASMGDTIRTVGAVFGMTDQAEQLVEQTDQRLATVREQITALRAATPRAPRAVVVYVRGAAGIFFILGADYGAADVLNELGLTDAADDRGITGLAPANAESLIDLDPEIVLTMRRGLDTAGGVDGLLSRPGMSGTVAGRNGRIVIAADSQLLSYGPRTPDNLLAVARAIYTRADEN